MYIQGYFDICYKLLLLLYMVSQSVWLHYIPKGTLYLLLLITLLQTSETHGKIFPDIFHTELHIFSTEIFLFSVCVVLLIFKEIEMMQYGKTYKGSRSDTYLNLNTLAEMWFWMHGVWGCVATACELREILQAEDEVVAPRLRWQPSRVTVYTVCFVHHSRLSNIMLFWDTALYL